jgi:hypothetical protein
MLGNSWVAAQLAAPPEGLSSMSEWVILILLSGDSIVSANSCLNSSMGSLISAVFSIFQYVTNIIDKIYTSSILMCDQKQFLTGAVKVTRICICFVMRYRFQHFISRWWRGGKKAFSLIYVQTSNIKFHESLSTGSENETYRRANTQDLTYIFSSLLSVMSEL